MPSSCPDHNENIIKTMTWWRYHVSRHIHQDWPWLKARLWFENNVFQIFLQIKKSQLLVFKLWVILFPTWLELKTIFLQFALYVSLNQNNSRKLRKLLLWLSDHHLNNTLDMKPTSRHFAHHDYLVFLGNISTLINVFQKVSSWFFEQIPR